MKLSSTRCGRFWRGESTPALRMPSEAEHYARDIETSYTEADNSVVVTTDSIKNTVNSTSNGPASA